MDLVVEPRFMEGRWWKYALALFGFQMVCWFLLGYRLNPAFDFWLVVSTGYFIYGAFFISIFLTFFLGSRGLRRLFWSAFIGFLLGDVSYFLLGFSEPVRRFNLLPIISFLQIYTTFLGLGIVIELGRYVYHRVRE